MTPRYRRRTAWSWAAPWAHGGLGGSVSALTGNREHRRETRGKQDEDQAQEQGKVSCGPRPHGGIFCQAATALTDTDLVLPRISGTIGIPDGRDDPETRPHGFPGRKCTLIVLENREHVAAAAPRVVSILAHAPDVRFLATIRKRTPWPGDHPVVPAASSRDGVDICEIPPKICFVHRGSGQNGDGELLACGSF